VRVGVVLRNSGRDGVEAVRRIADLAGELSYDAIWASDHVLAPREFAARYGKEWLDPFVSLAVAMERAPRVAIGLSVLVVPYRPALPTARAIASLQELSGGRLVVGVGSGWLEAEFAALHEDFANRGVTTDGRLDLIRHALAGNRDDFAAVEQPVPLLAAGNGPRVLRRAAALDGWFPIAQTPQQVAAGRSALPEGSRIALRTRLGVHKDRRDRPLFGTPDDVSADLTAYAAAGVTDLVVDHSSDALDDIERDLRELAKLIGDGRE
jgi:alkanesulfonate monooxygenase SsuD/methylene tetrahydromethanopterin reductase-like flavin-dependent oxidoreductase (luciferase family)